MSCRVLNEMIFSKPKPRHATKSTNKSPTKSGKKKRTSLSTPNSQSQPSPQPALVNQHGPPSLPVRPRISPQHPPLTTTRLIPLPLKSCAEKADQACKRLNSRDVHTTSVLPGGVLQTPEQVPFPNDGPLRVAPTLSDLILSKFDAVLSSIDQETFSGDDRELGTEHYLLRSLLLASSLQLVQSCMKLLTYGEDGALQARKSLEVQTGQSLPLSRVPISSTR